MPVTNLLKKGTPFLSLFLITACHSNNKIKPGKNETASATASSLTKLGSLSSTDFVITLESPIPTGKNVIYSPSLLYAWDAVTKEFGAAVLVGDTNSIEFKTMAASTSFQNSLAEDEYNKTAIITGDIIHIKAGFEKNLRFASKFRQLNEEIFFGDKRQIVDGFGLMRVPSQDTISTYQVLYYKNDDQFILKLIPRDTQHEIIVAKGLAGVADLGAALKQIKNLVAKGKTEKSHPQHEWKYKLTDEDMFAVPVIDFNIETNYKQLEGQHFFLEDERGYTITLASQQTAFSLDEEGGTVKSEAEISVVVDSVGVMPENRSHIKRLICDRPFYVVVKRAGEQNPYFMMKVNNTELLRSRK